MAFTHAETKTGARASAGPAFPTHNTVHPRGRFAPRAICVRELGGQRESAYEGL